MKIRKAKIKDLDTLQIISKEQFKVEKLRPRFNLYLKDNSYISKIDLIFDDTFITKVKYTDAFGAKSVVTISNFISKPRLSPSVFSYNYEVKDLITLD